MAKMQVGVRFNPYKWPEGSKMSDSVGKALPPGLETHSRAGMAVPLRFRKAGELKLPVGIMPFKGLSDSDGHLFDRA